MKPILLYMAVVLCTFCKASGFQVGGRHFFSLNPRFKFGFGMKPKVKSADGGKHQNATAGGEVSLASESNFDAGASANIDSNLGTTAKNTALAFVKGFDDLANIIGNVVGQAGPDGDHSKAETGSSNGDGSGAVSNTNTLRQESLAASHGNTETSAGGSGASSEDGSLRTAGDVSTGSGDGIPESKEGAASVANEQSIEFSSETTGGGSTEDGIQSDFVAILKEHIKNTIQHDLEEMLNELGTFPRPGASRDINELLSSAGMSTKSGGNQKLKGKRVAVSDGNVQNVEIICESAIDGTFKDESVSGRQHSSVGVTTNSEGHLKTKENQAPGFNGNELNGENSSDVSETTILNVGNKSDSGNLNLSSESGGDTVDPSEASNSAGIGVSGRSTCSTDEHLSGSVAAP